MNAHKHALPSLILHPPPLKPAGASRTLLSKWPDASLSGPRSALVSPRFR